MSDETMDTSDRTVQFANAIFDICGRKGKREPIDSGFSVQFLGQVVDLWTSDEIQFCTTRT